MQFNILNSAAFFEKIEFLLFSYIFSFSFPFSHNYLHESVFLIKNILGLKISYTTKYEIFNVYNHDESLIFFQYSLLYVINQFHFVSHMLK